MEEIRHEDMFISETIFYLIRWLVFFFFDKQNRLIRGQLHDIHESIPWLSLYLLSKIIGACKSPWNKILFAVLVFHKHQ